MLKKILLISALFSVFNNLFSMDVTIKNEVENKKVDFIMQQIPMVEHKQSFKNVEKNREIKFTGVKPITDTIFAHLSEDINNNTKITGNEITNNLKLVQKADGKLVFEKA